MNKDSFSINTFKDFKKAKKLLRKVKIYAKT